MTYDAKSTALQKFYLGHDTVARNQYMIAQKAVVTRFHKIPYA